VEFKQTDPLTMSSFHRVTLMLMLHYFHSNVVTNVINVIYNFDKKGLLSKVIYAEKVIYVFFKNKLIF